MHKYERKKRLSVLWARTSWPAWRTKRKNCRPLSAVYDITHWLEGRVFLHGLFPSSGGLRSGGSGEVTAAAAGCRSVFTSGGLFAQSFDADSRFFLHGVQNSYLKGGGVSEKKSRPDGFVKGRYWPGSPLRRHACSLSLFLGHPQESSSPPSPPRCPGAGRGSHLGYRSTWRGKKT